MEINNQYTRQKNFGDLNIGDVFLYDELVCMKVDDVTKDNDEILSTAIILIDGCHFAVFDNEKVIKVKAKLTIE
jgi:hypothetical protein